MFITKTKLSRRAVLQGMGAALGLPLLEAMIPALTPVVKTAGNPVKIHLSLTASCDAAQPCLLRFLLFFSL